MASRKKRLNLRKYPRLARAVSKLRAAQVELRREQKKSKAYERRYGRELRELEKGG